MADLTKPVGTFPPISIVVTLSGTALELTPIRLGELPRLLAVVHPQAEEVTGDPHWMALLGRHGESILRSSDHHHTA